MIVMNLTASDHTFAEKSTGDFQQLYALAYQQLKQVSDPQFSKYMKMLRELEPDVVFHGSTYNDPIAIMRRELYPAREDDIRLLGFGRAPAAKGYHHAFEGGLANHLLEMWSIWQHWKNQSMGNVGEFPILLIDKFYGRDMEVFKAILHHDLHKAWQTFELVSEDPWEAKYSQNPSQRRFSNMTKTLWLLQKHGIELDMEQYHTILVSEGGWAEIRTRETTPFAKLIYLLDEMSSNVISKLHL